MYKQILDTEHKRKSAVITLMILLLLLVGMFSLGMQYLDPPEEYGVAINFGNATMGKGNPVEDVKKAVAEPQKKVVEEQVKEEVKKEAPKAPVKKMVTSTTTKDVPVVSKTKKVTKNTPKPVKEIPKKVEKPKKPSKATTDALNSLLGGGSSNKTPKSEGDDQKTGVKGNKDGDKSSKYYGNTNSESGSNYNLAGRKALSKPIKKPACEEEGTVVVRIEVDANGKVVKAIPGVKGSTNTAPCLLQPAKAAALQTKWNADSKAPAKQRGTIIYKFSLSK